MDLETTFPLRYWLNSGIRTAERQELEWQLFAAGIDAQRFPAVDPRFVSKRLAKRRERGSFGFEGYREISDYAWALTIRLAIRRAKQSRAAAVLLIFDEAMFHPNFRSLAAAVDLPEDWGIFFFGGVHGKQPDPISAGVVRAAEVLHSVAFAVREPYYDQVLAKLDGRNGDDPLGTPSPHERLAVLHATIPTYACFPNLAWIGQDPQDDADDSLYQKGGTQKVHLDLVEETFAGLMNGPPAYPGRISPKLGLLFLTRGDVNHAEIWREFTSQSADFRVLSHPKNPAAITGGFLENTAVASIHETDWGSISLVRAALSLLREALEDQHLTHFVLLSESCVPAVPLTEMLRRLRFDPRSRFAWRTLGDAFDLQLARAAQLPAVPAGCWKFQSQWWLLDRMAAEWVTSEDHTAEFAAMGHPEEAYFSTVLGLLGYPVEDRVVNKDLTWTLWKKGHGSPQGFSSVGAETIRQIADSSAWFARKFLPGSDIGSWGLHRQDQLPRPACDTLSMHHNI